MCVYMNNFKKDVYFLNTSKKYSNLYKKLEKFSKSYKII